MAVFLEEGKPKEGSYDFLALWGVLTITFPVNVYQLKHFLLQQLEVVLSSERKAKRKVYSEE